MAVADEKNSFTLFHRFVRNIKRIIGFIPFGKTIIGSLAASLFLIRKYQEHPYENDDRALLEKHNAIELGMSETRVKWIMRGTPDKIIRPVGEDTTIWCYEDGTLFERWKRQSRCYFKNGVVVKKKIITNR